MMGITVECDGVAVRNVTLRRTIARRAMFDVGFKSDVDVVTKVRTLRSMGGGENSRHLCVRTANTTVVNGKSPEKMLKIIRGERVVV